MPPSPDEWLFGGNPAPQRAFVTLNAVVFQPVAWEVVVFYFTNWITFQSDNMATLSSIVTSQRPIFAIRQQEVHTAIKDYVAFLQFVGGYCGFDHVHGCLPSEVGG